MKKIILKLGLPLLKLYWKIFKPQTNGVRAILVKDNKILLVKHSYSDSWFLPGGGMKKGETFHQAIKRELFEELGISVENLKLHGIYNNFQEGKIDLIFVFSSYSFSTPTKSDAEIESFDMFDFENLPEKISPGTKRRIDEFLQQKEGFCGDW